MPSRSGKGRPVNKRLAAAVVAVVLLVAVCVAAPGVYFRLQDAALNGSYLARRAQNGQLAGGVAELYLVRTLHGARGTGQGAGQAGYQPVAVEGDQAKEFMRTQVNSMYAAGVFNQIIGGKMLDVADSSGAVFYAWQREGYLVYICDGGGMGTLGMEYHTGAERVVKLWCDASAITLTGAKNMVQAYSEYLGLAVLQDWELTSETAGATLVSQEAELCLYVSGADTLTMGVQLLNASLPGVGQASALPGGVELAEDFTGQSGLRLLRCGHKAATVPGGFYYAQYEPNTRTGRESLSGTRGARRLWYVDMETLTARRVEGEAGIIDNAATYPFGTDSCYCFFYANNRLYLNTFGGLTAMDLDGGNQQVLYQQSSASDAEENGIVYAHYQEPYFTDGTYFFAVRRRLETLPYSCELMRVHLETGEEEVVLGLDGYSENPLGVLGDEILFYRTNGNQVELTGVNPVTGESRVLHNYGAGSTEGGWYMPYNNYGTEYYDYSGTATEGGWQLSRLDAANGGWVPVQGAGDGRSYQVVYKDVALDRMLVQGSSTIYVTSLDGSLPWQEWEMRSFNKRIYRTPAAAFVKYPLEEYGDYYIVEWDGKDKSDYLQTYFALILKEDFWNGNAVFLPVGVIE